MAITKGKLYEIADLKSETASFYGFDGNLYVCDKDSRLHSAFFLMRRVKPLDFEHRRSGTTTPTGEGDARSVTSEVSGVELTVDAKKSRSVLALIPSRKRSLMIMKSAAKDVVCKVGENLLVRFKNPEEGKHPKSQAKQSDFEKKETDMAQKILKALQMLRAKQSRPEQREAESTTKEDSEGAGATKEQESMDVDETEKQSGFDASTGTTWLNVGGERQEFFLDTEENEGETAGVAREEDSEAEPPTKKRKLQGHRLPVPDAIRIPPAFDSWKRSQQIVHVCLERVRINDPVRYEEIIKRAALRGRVSRKRRDVWKYRKAIGELEVDLVKAKNTKDKTGVLELQRTLKTKRRALKGFEKEVVEYEKTKKRNTKPSKYDIHVTESEDTTDKSDSSSDDFSTMDEDELVRLEHDTYQVHKLKEKCKRLGNLQLTNAKVVAGLRQARDSGLEVLRADMNRKILEVELALKTEQRKRRAAETMKQAAITYLDAGHDNKSYADIIAGVNKELAASRASLQSDIAEQVAAARKEEQDRAAELAGKTHDIRIAKETELVEYIKALRTELKAERERFSDVCTQHERLMNMLKFPNEGGKQELLVWKGMLAQRRREVHGFHYDPLPEDDVKWADEFSSDDCDSSDQHDVAYGDSTSDGTTTEDETTDDEEEEEEKVAETVDEPVKEQEQKGDGTQEDKEKENTNQNANPEGEGEGGNGDTEAEEDDDKPLHPIEGRSIAADISLRRYSEAFPYCQIIKKEMREFFVKDNYKDPDQAYDEDELTMIDEVSWQDVSALGYRFEDKACLGPDFVPVCKTFDSAKAQHDKVNARRVELITLNAPLVEQFQAEEVERKAKLATPEGKAREAKELDEILEKEMKSRHVTEKRKQLMPHEKEERLEEFRRYMSGARAVTEQMSLHEIMQAEGKIDDFMRDKFPSYLPLKNHNFDFERRNVMRQYSKMTPEDELSKFNLYTGGQGQTEEKFEKLEERKASSAAPIVEDIEDEDVQM